MKSKHIITLFILTILVKIFQPIIVDANLIEMEDIYIENLVLEETNIDVEIYYIDLDKDGINERVEIVREAITPAYISYYVYDEITEDVLFSGENIYRGIIDITSDKIIEKIPIYNEGDFSIETTYEQNEYILKDGEMICVSSIIKNDQFKQDKMRINSNKYYSNPSRAEIEDILEEIALNKGIPPTILKAIAYTESNYRQFKDGEPLLSFDGVSWGIMQVTPKFYPDLDIQKLKYDIRYNIEAGANILLGKWGYAFARNPLIPIIGNADPRVLENWYFAIWAYNGLSESNNPNLMPYEHKGWIQYEAYQDKVLRYAREILNQEIVPVSKQLIPSQGKANPSIVYPELNDSKTDKYRLFVENQIVKVDSTSGINLRNDSMGFVKSIKNGDSLRIKGISKLEDGYWRYKVEELFVNGSIGQTGWVASNWILPDDKVNRGFQVWQKKTILDKRYIWTVKFNLSVDNNLISEDTVYVEDSRENKVDIDVYLENNKDIIKIKPVNPFELGEKYTLYIKGLRTNSGRVLKENIQMDFIVEKGRY